MRAARGRLIKTGLTADQTLTYGRLRQKALDFRFIKIDNYLTKVAISVPSCSDALRAFKGSGPGATALCSSFIQFEKRALHV